LILYIIYYMNSNQTYNCELKFVHITKTGGTSIEQIGKNIGVNWGLYDRNYLNQFRKKKKYMQVFGIIL
jgi:hypothetical protein